MKKFILMLVLSALTFGAEAADGYWEWYTSGTALYNGYIKAKNSKAQTSPMAGATLYIIGDSSYSSINNMAVPLALLEKLRAGTKTIDEVKAMAVDHAVTGSNGKAPVNTTYSVFSIPDAQGKYRSFYAATFIDFEGTNYVCFTTQSSLLAGSSTSTSPAMFVASEHNSSGYHGYAVYKGDSGQHGKSGWFAIGPVKVDVQPSQGENMSCAVYENDVLVTGDPVQVVTNANVKIVYTAADGYLFGNGEKTITHELVASSNPTVDTLEQTVYETQNTVVTNSQGKVLGEITLSKDWVNQVEKDNPGVALGDTQDNGITLLENEVLGLNGTVARDIPVIAPVQSADASKITFALDNVTVDDTSCAKVTYRVVPSEGEPSKSVGPDETVPMVLPETGVRYYKIEVDVGGTK